MLVTLMISLALTGQDPCIDLWSEECEADRRARPDCFDDNLTDRCAEAEQARVRKELGVVAADAERDAGVEMYRAFFVDGYGRDMPSVTFERRPGASPSVVVSGSGGRRLSATVPTDVWDQVREDARYFDRRFAPASTSEVGDEVVICLHSWVVTVEVIGPSTRDGRVPSVRRRTQDTCQDGLAVGYAFGLATAAIESLHPCNVLDPQNYRNDITRLQECLGLQGDQLAVVQFLNSRDRRWNVIPAGQSEDAWKSWLGFSNTRILDWNGLKTTETPARPGVPRVSVAGFLAERSAELGEMWLGIEDIRGNSSTEIVIVGDIWISDRATPSNEHGLEAAYQQVWRRDSPDGGWRLESLIVDAFVPVELTTE